MSKTLNNLDYARAYELVTGRKLQETFEKTVTAEEFLKLREKRSRDYMVKPTKNSGFEYIGSAVLYPKDFYRKKIPVIIESYGGELDGSELYNMRYHPGNVKYKKTNPVYSFNEDKDVPKSLFGKGFDVYVDGANLFHLFGIDNTSETINLDKIDSLQGKLFKHDDGYIGYSLEGGFYNENEYRPFWLPYFPEFDSKVDVMFFKIPREVDIVVAQSSSEHVTDAQREEISRLSSTGHWGSPSSRQEGRKCVNSKVRTQERIIASEMVKLANSGDSLEDIEFYTDEAENEYYWQW